MALMPGLETTTIAPGVGHAGHEPGVGAPMRESAWRAIVVASDGGGARENESRSVRARAARGRLPRRSIAETPDMHGSNLMNPRRIR